MINLPKPILVGENTSLQTGKKLKEFGVSKVLCIYDKGIKSTGIADKVIATIREEGITVVEFDGVEVDSPDTVANQLGEIGRREKVDGLVGIGGGSCLDTTKLCNILLTNPGPITDYLTPDKKQNPGKIMILIPTTSGTGSEVSRIAAIKIMSSGLKSAAMCDNCEATLAIVDPMLTLGMPPLLTACVGADVLAHAMEAYTSVVLNPTADIFAIDAIERASKALVTAVKDGSNVEARFNMSYACTLASIAFRLAPPHIGHSIGNFLGTNYHVSHGAACGIALPGVIEFVSEVKPDRVRNIGKAMGLDLAEGLSNKEIGEQVAAALRKIYKEINHPTLKSLNIPETDLPQLAKDITGDFLIGFCPRKATEEDFLAILQKEYSLSYII